MVNWLSTVLTVKGRMTMTDRQNVIKGLECCATGNGCPSKCPYFEEVGKMVAGECITALQADALELLKKLQQSNKEGEWVFIMHNPAYSPFDGGPSKFCKCSNCGYITGDLTNYCPRCGQNNKAVMYMKDAKEQEGG